MNAEYMHNLAINLDIFNRGYVNQELRMADVMRDYRSPYAPENWPWSCDAFDEWCKEKQVSPVSVEAVHDFLTLYRHNICECCGAENPYLIHVAEEDPFGTGDSPQGQSFVGTQCCSAGLLNASGAQVNELGEEI